MTTEISDRTFAVLMTAGLALPWLLVQGWLYARESKRRTWSVLGWAPSLWILIAVIIPGYALGVLIARRRRKQEHDDAIARTARNQVR